MEEALKTVTTTDIFEVEEGGSEKEKTNIFEKTGPHYSENPTPIATMKGYR